MELKAYHRPLMALLHSGSADEANQAAELIASLDVSAEELEGIISGLLRSSYTSRKISGLRLLNRFADQVPDALFSQARSLIERKLGGRNRETVDRGLAMLAALDHPPTTVSIWSELLAPGCDLMFSGYRANILRRLTAMVPEDATVPHTELSYFEHFGDAWLRSATPPPPLLRMPALRSLQFDRCQRIVPLWLPMLSSLRRLALRNAVQGALTTAALPLALEHLSLPRSPVTSVSLELPTLRELDLSGCAELSLVDLSGCTRLEVLDLSGCARLEALPASMPPLRRLDLSGCAALVHLPPSMPGLEVLDVSGCTRLPALPPALRAEPGLEIQTRGCLSLRTQPSALQAPTTEDTPKQRKATVRALSKALRSRSVPDASDAIDLLPHLMAAERLSLFPALVTGTTRWLRYRDRVRVQIGLEMVAREGSTALADALWAESFFTREGALDGALAAAHPDTVGAMASGLLPLMSAAARQRVVTMDTRRVTDWSVLCTLVGLRVLAVHDAPEPELPDLSALTALEEVRLEQCRAMTSLAALRALPSLRRLTVARLYRLVDRETLTQLRARGVIVEIMDKWTQRKVGLR